MMGQLIPTPLDFEFAFLGFPVRVNGLFWLVNLLFGWESALGMDAYLGVDSPGRGPLVVMWIGVVFVSILLHELGHALAFRRYGIHSMIALHHFGGFAMPVASSGRSGMRLSPTQDIFVSAAGPLIQLALAAIIAALTLSKGYHIPGFEWITANQGLGDLQTSGTMYALIRYLMFTNVWWAVLNLAPVWPLDGGHIAESTSRLYFNSTHYALIVSLVAAIVIAVWGFKHGQQFMGIFFASLALTSYQRLQGDGRSW